MIWLAAIWSLGFWLFGVAIPLVAIFLEGSRDLTLNQFFDPVVLNVVWVTVKQVFWSVVFSGIIGLILGLCLGRVSQWGRGSRVLSIFSLPMVVPTVVAGIGWLVWIGNSGIFSRLGIHLDLAYRFEAVILAHSFYNIPWVALAVAHARRLVPESRIEALRVLGAGRWSVFVHGVWPSLRWAWATACAQVMGFCAMSFALVLVLGGGPPVQTLETEVYSRLKLGGVDWSGALICAFWELLLTLIPWGVVLFLQDREKFKISENYIDFHKKSNRVGVWATRSFLGLGVFFLFPYLGVFSVSWGPVLNLLRTPEVLQALKFSFSLSVWSSVLTILTALSALGLLFHSKVPSGVRSLLGFLFALPSGVSVIILGLGVWIAYGRWIDPFEGSPAAMVLLQVTLFFTLAMRTLWPVASSRDPRSTDVALSLGASSIRAWIEVEWPRWQGPVLVASGAVFGAVLGEVGAVSLFASEKWVSLPGLISQSMQGYRFEEAQILAGLLLTSSLVATLGAVELGSRLGGISRSP